MPISRARRRPKPLRRATRRRRLRRSRAPARKTQILPEASHLVAPRTRDRRLPSVRRRAATSILGAAIVTTALGFELSGARGQFTVSLRTAPILTLLLVAALQLVALLSRSEAWHVCVRAAGGTVSRRLLFRAAGFGYLASVLNGSLGLATRIACLRRVAPTSTPRVPALIAAEVPIIAVEIALTALFSFTLIGPLGIPWWLPVIAVVVISGAGTLLRRVSERHRLGLWTGLAVMRHGRNRMIVFVLLAVCAQIARNYFVLHAIGVNASLFDSAALLIAMFTLGQLPIGPSLGAAAAVLILGSHGVGAAAAAGVLLTVTATVGSLSYAAWATVDQTISGTVRAKLKIAAAPTQA